MSASTVGYVLLAAGIVGVVLVVAVRVAIKAFRNYVRTLWPH